MIRGPLAVIAEVTHRCPLHCVYCSNPLEMAGRAEELRTDEWAHVFAEAAEMGALQVDLTGGEPLARMDVTELVAAARSARLYVSLITSGIGLTQERLEKLGAAGLDHIQLSFQDAEAEGADEIAGTAAHARKIEIARLIAKTSLALTLNFVVHRRNMSRVGRMIELAEQAGAQRVEIANVQYYGWALENREALLPSREQLDEALAVVESERERLAGRIKIEFVAPDYHARFPKACMGGWGRKLMLIHPAGRVMPCHAANVIPGMQFANVRERPLRWIWEESEAFTRFRGEEWMPEPCRSCERKEIDFGGCRCQAFLLAGDAAVTDPVCSLAPTHGLVAAMVESANEEEDLMDTTPPGGAIVQPLWLYRTNPQ